MSFADAVNKKLSQSSSVASSVGIFLEMVDGLARVNVHGATVDIRCDGWTPPVPGMPVRVETVHSIMRVVGPSQAKSARGEVLESLDGDTRARVSVDGEEFTLSVMAPYVPIPTDPVVIDWQSGFILGEQAAAVQTSSPLPVGNAGAPFSGLLVQARSSGKYDYPNSNWWGTGDVRASNNNDGAWFYHGELRVLAGASVDSVELYLPTPWRAQGVLKIGLHPHPTKPGGAPSIGSLFDAPARSDWVRLPDSWGNYLRDNPDSGIGVTSGSGDNQWPGVTGDRFNPMSGALRFAGSR